MLPAEMSAYQRNGFFAQETLVQIIPKFEMEHMDFLSGRYGPFRPNYAVQVPLWLALYFRETKTCRIQPPAELTVASLQAVIAGERESSTNFESLSLDFFDVSRLLLKFAAEDIPDSDEVHRLLSELELCRLDKLQKILNSFNSGFLNAGVLNFPQRAFFFPHFGSGEIELLRSSFLPALNDGVLLNALHAPRPIQRSVAYPGSVDERDHRNTDELSTIVDSHATVEQPTTTVSGLDTTSIPTVRRRRTLRQR